MRSSGEREPHHHHGDPDDVLAAAAAPVGDLRDRLDAALAETGVAGLRVDPSTGGLDLLLHAGCMDVDGHPDADLRRVLRLIRPHRIDVTVLRAPDDPADDEWRPIPLSSLEAVEEFFASLLWASTMCGRGFLGDGLPPQPVPGLSVDVECSPAPHGLAWFADCELEEDDQPVAYRIEGWVGFEQLAVVDADGDPIPVEEFCAARERWWRALLGGWASSPDDVRATAWAWRAWAGPVALGHHGAAPREA